MLYNGALAYAVAAGRLDGLPNPDAKSRELRSNYETRALTLLRQALEALPAVQRPGFWQGSVRTDKAMHAIRSSTGYRQMMQQYAAAGKE